VIHWWIIPVQIICGLFWALGGAAGGSKLFRRIADPLVITGATFFHFHQFGIFAAVPFMVWFCPWSYGETSNLFIYFKNITGDQRKADFYTRGILYVWYWAAYGLALLIPR